MDNCTIAFSFPRQASSYSPPRQGKSSRRPGLAPQAFASGSQDSSQSVESTSSGISPELAESCQRDLKNYLVGLEQESRSRVRASVEKWGEATSSTPYDPRSTPLDQILGNNSCLNFLITGSDSDAKSARRAIYRHFPRPLRHEIKCSPAHVIMSSLDGAFEATASARRSIQHIASTTGADITVVSMGTRIAKSTIVECFTPTDKLPQPSPSQESSPSDVSSASSRVKRGETTAPRHKPSLDKSEWVQFTYGLEQRRTCHLVVTGAFESVERAKVRLLVMLDELVSPEAYPPHSIFRKLIFSTACSLVPLRSTTSFMPWSLDSFARKRI